MNPGKVRETEPSWWVYYRSSHLQVPIAVHAGSQMGTGGRPQEIQEYLEVYVNFFCLFQNKVT